MNLTIIVQCDHCGTELEVVPCQSYPASIRVKPCLLCAQQEQQAMKLATRVGTALNVINRYGGIDGAHHKQWVLDQVVRILTGDQYDMWVQQQKMGEDGAETYEWDTGIAP